MKKFLLLATSLFLCLGIFAAPKSNKLDDQVLKTMKTATEYMMDVVSYRGGFVWTYLPDFSRQWGEMEAKRTMAWVQSGTPQMGNLLLDAYHATGDEYYYEAATRVANALIWGQQDNGGWNYCFDFAGEASLKDWYATVGRNGWRLEEFQHYYGNATFDDSSTTDAAKFILRIYAEKFDPKFRPALDKAINFVLESQYPVGGWPQRYPLKFDHPFRGRPDYSSFITLNDDVIPQCTDFLLQCLQVLGTQNLKEPILRAMRLVIMLQQGEPYAGWADQYTVDDLKPAHARSYEPRAISNNTTQSMCRQLMQYYRLTGDTRFLAGIPAALKYLETQKLPKSEVDKLGRPYSDNMDSFLAARFINPDNGEPQYVHRMGSNVQNGHYYYDQTITPTIGHYSSYSNVNLKALRDQYEQIKNTPVEELTKDSPLLSNEPHPLAEYYVVRMGAQAAPRGGAAFGGRPMPTLEDQAKDIIAALTKEGCWLSPLRTTSNPYQPYEDSTPSTETKYVSTNVGDQYDTSPYSNTDPSIQCISTSDYINKMGTLIRYHLSVKQ
ncbi:MAG: pectate lyase [Bacteroidales bacterium]|nr:pectate lyase [Bacteroidales bacterium]